MKTTNTNDFPPNLSLGKKFPILTTGRRKSATAQVKLFPGIGEISINENPDFDYFPNSVYSRIFVLSLGLPYEKLGLDKKYNLVIKVQGGGFSGQADAIKLAIARAHSLANDSCREPLKVAGLLTTDSRCKERKKYGLKKARKASQFSKR